MTSIFMKQKELNTPKRPSVRHSVSSCRVFKNSVSSRDGDLLFSEDVAAGSLTVLPVLGFTAHMQS